MDKFWTGVSLLQKITKIVEIAFRIKYINPNNDHKKFM